MLWVRIVSSLTAEWQESHCLRDKCRDLQGTRMCLHWLGCRYMKRRKAAREAAPVKPTPKAMTPSAAYPYFGEKPMQFRGVKVRASPKVRLWCCNPGNMQSGALAWTSADFPAASSRTLGLSCGIFPYMMATGFCCIPRFLSQW